MKAAIEKKCGFL